MKTNSIHKGYPEVTRILLADDHHEIRGMIRDILERQPGLSVVAEAANGQEAIVKAIRLKPDIVVMDVRMPIMNGIEAARRLLSVLPEVGIMILSLLADQRTVATAYRVGAKGYLPKDCIYEDLIPAISAIKNNQSFASRCSKETFGEM